MSAKKGMIGTFRVSYTFVHGDKYAEKKNVEVREEGTVQVIKYALLMYLNMSKILKPEDACRGRMKISFAGKTIVEDMLTTDARDRTSPTFDYIFMYSRKYKIKEPPLFEFYIPEEVSGVTDVTEVSDVTSAYTVEVPTSSS